MITISQALYQSVETLNKISYTPNLDAQILLANTLEKPRAWVISHPEVELSFSENSRFQDGINSLVEGIPLPYIIGKWEFYGLEFIVTPETLIPRPETELMVELALEWLGKHQGRRSAADVGTGSGCIAVAIAKNSPDVSFIASDISHSALRIARKNSVQHGVNERINFLQADLMSPISHQFDLICANLPYIPSQRLPTLKIHGHEPDTALNGGKDGMEFISELLVTSSTYTQPGALLLIEIDSSQGRKFQSAAKNLFPYAEISLHTDLAHHDRLVKIQLPISY